MSNWINVDKELPQVDFEVLCSCDDDVELCTFRDSNDGWWFETSDDGQIFQATHWQSLPAPAAKGE